VRNFILRFTTKSFDIVGSSDSSKMINWKYFLQYTYFFFHLFSLVNQLQSVKIFSSGQWFLTIQVVELSLVYLWKGERSGSVRQVSFNAALPLFCLLWCQFTPLAVVKLSKIALLPYHNRLLIFHVWFLPSSGEKKSF